MTLRFVRGNLFEADVEAIVNTVNTVGVMGKGIALMFKEKFPDNYLKYEAACKKGAVHVGEMFVTKNPQLFGPQWIINFPTKSHWRNPSKIEWIEVGLENLREFVLLNKIKSIAIPPLGAGNGGLDWQVVRPSIEEALRDLTDVEILIYEPTREYQNVAKRAGVRNLTPARALIAELIRRYSVLGIECTLLEVQKLGYLLDRTLSITGGPTLGFAFEANKYGPYSNKLAHLLDALDGSYLHCSKRIADAGPLEAIHFKSSERVRLEAFLLKPEAQPYRGALEATSKLIAGFESPLGMELLATVDWLVTQTGVPADVRSVKAALPSWPGGAAAGRRKLRLFEDRTVSIALDALEEADLLAA